MSELFYPDGIAVLPNNYKGSELTRWEKIVLHTTESKNYSPNSDSYYGHQLWPHATLAFSKKYNAWKIFNHLPLTRSSACMKNLAGGVETNRDGCIQIEIAWTAGEGQDLPKEALDVLKSWMLWVCKQTEIPYLFIDDFHYYLPEDGQKLGKETWRRSGPAFDAFRGILGHQHAAENVHGDPGKLNIAYLKVTPPAAEIPQEENSVMLDAFQYGKDLDTFAIDSAGNLVTRYYQPAPTPGWKRLVLGGGCIPNGGVKVVRNYNGQEGRLDVFGQHPSGMAHAFYAKNTAGTFVWNYEVLT